MTTDGLTVSEAAVRLVARQSDVTTDSRRMFRREIFTLFLLEGWRYQARENFLIAVAV
jgi:hypothetical protein